MKSRTNLAVLFAVILIIAVSCGDDCVTCIDSSLIGGWILHSSGTEDQMQMLPDDTLTFNANGTGTYRPEIGMAGPYDFTYRIRHDTLFQTVTAGQFEGAEYARKYELRADSLYYIEESGSVPVYTVWLRK